MIKSVDFRANVYIVNQTVANEHAKIVKFLI